VQVEAEVPAQVPPVQTKDVAAGVQLTVNVDDPPIVIEGGAATNVQLGFGAVAVTVALTVLPVPPAFTPATV
jgi:hypothetical protein